MTELKTFIFESLLSNGDKEVLYDLIAVTHKQTSHNVKPIHVVNHLHRIYSNALHYIQSNAEPHKYTLSLFQQQKDALSRLVRNDEGEVPSSNNNRYAFASVFAQKSSVQKIICQKSEFLRFILFHVIRVDQIKKIQNTQTPTNLFDNVHNVILKQLGSIEPNNFSGHVGDSINVTPRVLNTYITLFDNILNEYIHDPNSDFDLDKKSNTVVSLTTSQEAKDRKASGVKKSEDDADTELFTKNDNEVEPQDDAQKDTEVTVKRVDFLRHSRNHIDALLLPSSSANLTLAEKKEIIQILLDDIRQHREKAVLVLLMLVTSKNLHELLNADLSDEINHDSDLSISSRSCTFTRRSLQLEKSYQLADNFEWSRPHSEYLTLPLPNCLKSFLSHKTLNDKKLYCLFTDCKTVTDYLLEVNHKMNYSRRELSKKSIQYALFDEVAQINDGVFASLLFATDAYANPISLYYTSASSSLLLQQYSQALIKIGIPDVEHNIKFKTVNNTFLGSQVVVETKFLATRIRKKRKQIDKLISKNKILEKNDVIQLHNHLALFTASIFAFNCFCRDSKELYFDEYTIDDKRKLILVSDKLTELSNHIRFMPLTSFSESQLYEYKRHLKFTSQKLKQTDPTLSLNIHHLYQDSLKAEMPLIFIINAKMEIQSISSKDIVNYIEPSLPNNFFRHYMASNLPQNIALFRQTFLGHFNEFQQPFSDFSTMPPRFSEDVYTQLNGMLVALFDKPVSAIKSIGNNPKIDWKLPIHSYHGNWYEREVNNIEAVKLLKSTIINSFPYLLKETNDSQLRTEFKELLQHLSQGSQLSQSILSKHVNNCLEYFKKTNKTKLRQKFLREQANTTARLDVILLDKGLDYYRKRFLYFMCSDYHNERELTFEDKKQSNQDRMLLKFYLSMLLFQPSAFILLYSSKEETVSLRVLADTIFLEFGHNYVNCIPVNTLSSSFLLGLVDDNLTQIDTPKRTELEEYYRYFIQYYIEQNSYIDSKETVKGFLSWIEHSRAMDTPQLIVTDREKNSAISTSYPLDAYARLLTNKPFFMPYVNDNIPVGVSGTYTFFSSTRSRKEEKKLLVKIINALDFKINNTTNTSTKDILTRSWANAVKSSDTSIQALIDASQKLSEIAVALLIYAYALTDTTINNTDKRYKASTVINYFSTLSAALHENLFNVQITSLDESTFIEIYTKAIERAKIKNSHNAAQLARNLYDFHTEVSRYLAMAEPNWDYFSDFQEFIQDNNGIARLFTEKDYINAFTLIENSEELDDFERDIHLLVFTLGYRLGMRPREIKNLHLHQISDSIITISSSRFSGVKSVNSARRINYSAYLNDKEISILNNVRKAVSRHVTKRKEVAIFANANNFSELINFNQLINNITHVMRHVSCHAKMRFYDLRHSFINYHYWIMSTAIDDERYIKVLKQWSRSTDLEEFRARIKKHHLGNAPDVGATWAIAFAKIMGHSIRTQREYYHNNILALEELNANQIVSEYLSNNEFYALHVKDDNRYKKYFNKQVRLRLRKYSEHFFIEESSANVEQPLILRSSLQHLNSYHQFLLIYKLIMLQPRFTQTEVAEMLGCDESFVETVLEDIIGYIKKTRCRCIDLRNFKSYTVNSIPAEVKKTHKILSKRFVKKHLIEILLMNSEHDDFINLWLNCSHYEKLLVKDYQLDTVKRFADASNLDILLTTKIYKIPNNVITDKLHNVKLTHKNSNQSLNFKLSFLMSIVYVIKQLKSHSQ